MSDEQPIELAFIAGQQELILSELATLQDTLDALTVIVMRIETQLAKREVP